MEVEINEQVEDAVNEMLEDCRRPLAGNTSPEGRRIERLMKGLMRKHAKAILKAERQRARRERSLVRTVNQRLRRAWDAAACL
jgi:hypothetical protein